jgi:hypothetical protein
MSYVWGRRRVEVRKRDSMVEKKRGRSKGEKIKIP